MSDSGDLLAHRVEGEGEPLLLLNGGMMTWAAWGPVATRLRQRHRLVLCDLRGQLMSPGPAPAELGGHLPDLTALLDHLGLDSVHVLGTSYGGEVGLLMAATRPERVRSLVAATVSDYTTDAMVRGIEDLRRLIAQALAGGDRGLLHERVVREVYSESFRRRYRDQLAARREQVAALPDRWFQDLDGLLTAMEELDLRPHLGAVRCPTLVVIAAHDQTIPPPRSRALAAAISGAETAVHDTSGHALVAEDPEWLAEVTLEFLAQHAHAGAIAETP